MNYMFNLNADDTLRQNIMGIKARYEVGGLEKFSGMTLETLNKLAENNFVDLAHSFNNCPTVNYFKNFMEKYPNEGLTAHGYLISPEREDYHVSIEGLEAKSTNDDFISDFIRTFSNADELDSECGKQRCWYD